MSIQKILIAFNFTHLDQKAIDFVTSTFAHLDGLEITFFHAYTPVPEIETQASEVTGKLKSSLGYLSQQIMQREIELEEITKKLSENELSGTQMHTIFRPRKKDIASEIINLNRDMNFDVIVLNHKSARVTRFFSGSVSRKVLLAIKETKVRIFSSLE